MEAVPRLHMLWFALKTSPEGTSFLNLKKYIAECYQEDPEAYSKEVYALETLRNTAMRPEKEMQGCATLKRYYCQLHSLSNRFPDISERGLFTFTWKDLYVNNVVEVTDLRYEMAAVLFNIAALHTQVGASVSRGDVDGMKLACTHFQCAAWAFGELKDKYQGVNNSNDFMTPELLVFMQQVSFAQAQECILEKSLIDNRKPNIVAKVTAQIVGYYSSGLVALLSGGDDGSIAHVVDSSVFKLWKKYVKFKISYLNCILFLYQGQQAEEKQKMGERVVLFQAAWDKLEEARKESKGLPDQKEIMESLTFTADVVEAKRKNAKNENEFIYHESVPELSDLSAVQGANLVNGISFSVTDPETAGEDIFGRLVPMKAHEASSLYSEEKAQILRKYGTKIEEKDKELALFMSSLNLESLNISEEKSNKIPQGIVDRCASLNSKTNAIPDLIQSMSNLAEICADVETNLKEIKEILSEEDLKEKQYQQNTGVHRSNAHFTELSREFHKYLEAHQKAGESNDTLRRAMELHVNNLKILSRPLKDIQSSVPKLSGDVDESFFKDLKLILNKVNEMKAQRAQFHADLRIAINDDDITSKVIAHGNSGKGLKELFEKELAKHDRICTLIDQNITAQGNILAALTESYAKCASVLKTMNDVKHKKDNFYSSLAASYDVYEDLMGKSSKGLEFYKKLQGNVQKLLTRARAARDVQNEDRQQRMKSVKQSDAGSVVNVPYPSTNSGTPKLKDYLKNTGVKSISAGVEPVPYIPPIRPNPLGSENPTAAACVAPSVSSVGNYYPAPNEPPPPYTPNNQYYEGGYTNQMYHANPAEQAGYNHMQYSAPQYTYSQASAITPAVSSSSYTTPDPSTRYNSNPPTQQIAAVSLASQMDNLSLQQQNFYGYQQPNMVDPSYAQPLPQTYQYSPSLLSQASTYYTQSPAVSEQQQSQQSAYTTQPFQSGSTAYPIQDSSTAPPYSQPSTQQTAPSAMQAFNTQNQFPATSYAPINSQGPTQPTAAPVPYPSQQPQSVSYSAPSGVISSTSQSQYPMDPPQYSSFSSHPGYNFNSLTGTYEYASGYQADSMQLYGQYTNAMAGLGAISSTTESVGVINQQTAVDQQNVQNSTQSSYYTIPYGYQSTGAVAGYPIDLNQPVNQTAVNGQNQTNNSAMTYMQSGSSNNNTNNTQTTISGAYANSTAQQSQAPPKPVKKEATAAKKSSNIDLLSDVDFAASQNVISTPLLQPQIAPTKPESPAKSVVSQPTAQPAKESIPELETKIIAPVEPTLAPTTAPMPDRKSSCDNLSICSDLSSIDQNFDWDSVSIRSEKHPLNSPMSDSPKIVCDPFEDAKVLKYFHKEVERYEKSLESLNVKMLNGKTPLMNKWKDLHDLLAKDDAKRSTAISKLFPEKNRSTDCIPFDHARVVLERSTDDFINAAFVKNLGPNCPNLIIAQTPLQNTVIDFWSMIWTQKTRTVLCLHTPNEILDPFWPQDISKEVTFDDFAVVLVKQTDLTHCVEYNLKLSLSGADAILDLSLLQIKAWTKSSPAQILGIAQNALDVYRQRSMEFKTTAPLIMNCLTGSERSGVVALSICAILATQTKRPLLINVVDVWYRICSERKNALKDASNFELSMKIVLSHAHDVLNKRGIMTSYQMKNAQTVIAKEKEEVKDPLNDLDPLWKLK